VIITEAGYYTTGTTTNPNSVDVSVQAKYTLDLLLDRFQVGNVKTYLYELLDQKSWDGSSEDIPACSIPTARRSPPRPPSDVRRAACRRRRTVMVWSVPAGGICPLRGHHRGDPDETEPERSA
jgi:hypothetical protein